MGEIITQVRGLMLIFVLGVTAALTEVTTSKAKEEGDTTQPVRGDILDQPLWWNTFSAYFSSQQEAVELTTAVEHNNPVITGCCESTHSMDIIKYARNSNGANVTIVQNVNVNGKQYNQLFYTETCDITLERLELFNQTWPAPDCRCNCSCMLEDILSQAIVYTNRTIWKVKRDYVFAGKICRCVNRAV